MTGACRDITLILVGGIVIGIMLGFTSGAALTVSASASRGGSRRVGKRRVALRHLLAFIALYALPGCARDVLMLNPRTGETTTCRASTLDPWSQQEACVGDHLAHGWRKFE